MVKSVPIFLLFSFERQQALVQEQLARLAQKERDMVATTGLDDLTPALIVEKGKVHEEQEKAKILVSHALCLHHDSKLYFTGLYCTEYNHNKLFPSREVFMSGQRQKLPPLYI